MDLYLEQTLYEVRKVEFLVNILVYDYKFLTVTKEQSLKDIFILKNK